MPIVEKNLLSKIGLLTKKCLVPENVRFGVWCHENGRCHENGWCQKMGILGILGSMDSMDSMGSLGSLGSLGSRVVG